MESHSFPPVVVVEAAGAKQNSALMERYDALSDESEFLLSARGCSITSLVRIPGVYITLNEDFKSTYVLGRECTSLDSAVRRELSLSTKAKKLRPCFFHGIHSTSPN
jgi:hypothetical protein